MKHIVVDLTISAEEYLKLYRGTAKTVQTRSRNGLRIHFPANILQPYVNRKGIHGSFVIDYDDANRFQQIRRL